MIDQPAQTASFLELLRWGNPPLARDFNAVGGWAPRVPNDERIWKEEK